MGSPLAPTLASIFLQSLESNIDKYSVKQPSLYKRYVDDIFLIFENKSDVEPFLKFMNSLHPNIELTMENENNNH